MEEAGVLVTSDGVTDFGTQFPVKDTLFYRDMERVGSKRTKKILRGGEGPTLLKAVEDTDENPTILFPLGHRSSPPSPAFTGKPDLAKASNQAGSLVGAAGGSPRSNDCGTKRGVKIPRLLVSKNEGFRGGGGDSREEGDVMIFNAYLAEVLRKQNTKCAEDLVLERPGR